MKGTRSSSARRDGFSSSGQMNWEGMLDSFLRRMASKTSWVCFFSSPLDSPRGRSGGGEDAALFMVTMFADGKKKMEGQLKDVLRVRVETTSTSSGSRKRRRRRR